MFLDDKNVLIYELSDKELELEMSEKIKLNET